MLNAIVEGIRGFLLPVPVSQTVFIRGGTVSVKSPPRVRTLSLYRLRFHVPGGSNYGVEYRVSERGEFRVDRGSHGGVVVRNNRDMNDSVPVCWLPERFLGKNVDRYIVHVDGKGTNYKAGVKDVSRTSANETFPNEFLGSHARLVS
jgi:hypothetical protein